MSTCVSGITHEEMVQESKRHWHRLEQNAQRQKVRLVWGAAGGRRMWPSLETLFYYK